LKKEYFIKKETIMKKIMMIAAMLVATVAAKAQFAPGTWSLQPKVGIELTEISYDDAKLKFGLGAGVEGQYQINNWLGVSAALMYQQQGSKVKNSSYKIKLEYINIPVMAKFYVTKGLSLNAGMQFGFLTTAKIDSDDIKSYCNKVDVSIPLSIAYELPMGVTFEARYTTGLTNVFKEAYGFPGTSSDADKLLYDKNEVLMLTVGYKFAL